MGGVEAPGYASTRGGQAPGQASVGGVTLASTEPTPIGVVRTDYSQPEPRSTGYSDPTHGQPGMGMGQGMGMGMAPRMAPGMGMGGTPYRGPSAIPAWMAHGPSRRPSVLGHMFGYSGLFGRRREARDAQLASDHAAIPMGMSANNGKLNELPASMVYGR